MDKENIKIEQYAFYKAKINYHREDDLVDGLLPNGSIVTVNALYTAGESERYANEMIFQAAEMHGTIPERDLIILEKSTVDEYNKNKIIHSVNDK